MSPDRAALPADDDLAAPPAIEGASIDGTVTDFEGVSLPGVRVEVAESGGAPLDGLPALTDVEGRFRLEGLGTGPYDLRFALATVRARTLRVPAGTTGLAVRIARPRGILLVAKTLPGDPVPESLHVVLERETAHGPVREHSGPVFAMRALFTALRPGRWRVTAWGGPYQPVCVSGVVVAQDAAAPEVIVLLSAPGGTIDVRVEDARGGGGCLLGWRRVDGDAPWPRDATSARTDADGRHAIRGLPPGRYRVFAGRPDGPIAERTVDVEEGTTTSVVLH
jgi:hypothetical protein